MRGLIKGSEPPRDWVTPQGDEQYICQHTTTPKARVSIGIYPTQSPCRYGLIPPPCKRTSRGCTRVRGGLAPSLHRLIHALVGHVRSAGEWDFVGGVGDEDARVASVRIGCIYA